MSDLSRMIEVAEMIAADMEADAEKWEGAPFTGSNVAEQFGEQGAAIHALAKMVAVLARAADGGATGDSEVE